MNAVSPEQPRLDHFCTVKGDFGEICLDGEEQRVLHFLREQVPELVKLFISFVPDGRRVTLNRLATSMLREDVAGFASDSYDMKVAKCGLAGSMAAIGENWRRAVESLREFGVKYGAICKVLPLPGKRYLIAPANCLHAFRNFEVEGPLLYVYDDGVRPLQHAVELLQLIRGKEITEESETQRVWSRFADELRNGSANQTLACTYHEERKKQLRKLASEYGATTTLQLVELLKTHDRDYDSSLFFEQLCVEGHHLHPGAKTKICMEPAAVYRYAPELEGAPDIRFVGVRKEYAEWASIEEKDLNEALFDEYPELPEALAREFTAKRGLRMPDYVFVPVHCWQLERVIPRIYKDELAQGIVVPVKGVSVPSRATTSFRTVVPQKGVGRSAVKMAVNSQMTSTIRSISANTAQNGPEFSKLILAIMQKEPQLTRTFVPICETAGVSFKVSTAEKDSELAHLKSRNLSSLLRENVEAFVKPDELAIVGSSLYAESPLTGKPIFAELVERYAISTGEGSLRQAAFQLVSEYATVALPGFITLMVKYGVGLEGHLQNVVPVFKHGRPVRMLFRDWGGARIYVPRLERQGLVANFCASSVTVTMDLKEMRNKVFYTVFQNQMAATILQARNHFEVPERELWRELYRISNGVLERLTLDPKCTENALQDREALYAAKMNYKALTKMRLATTEGDDRYVEVPNPLCEFSDSKPQG